MGALKTVYYAAPYTTSHIMLLQSLNFLMLCALLCTSFCLRCRCNNLEQINAQDEDGFLIRCIGCKKVQA